MGRVQDKVALITGGARGLGAEDARLLAREGAKVIITDVLDGAETAAETGGDFLSHDVTDEQRWIEVIETVRDRYGRLDILVNNAGLMVSGNPETTSIGDWRKVFAVAVEGAFLGIKHSLPLLRQGDGGSIINVASITALRHFPDTLAYASAKGAMLAMTTNVAGYCRKAGYPVRCNAVLPSGMDTPMVQQRIAEAARATDGAASARAPSQLGSPVDVANAVLYLASDEARYVNGIELIVDNGYCAG